MKQKLCWMCKKNLTREAMDPIRCDRCLLMRCVHCGGDAVVLQRMTDDGKPTRNTIRVCTKKGCWSSIKVKNVLPQWQKIPQLSPSESKSIISATISVTS